MGPLAKLIKVITGRRLGDDFTYRIMQSQSLVATLQSDHPARQHYVSFLGPTTPFRCFTFFIISLPFTCCLAYIQTTQKSLLVLPTIKRSMPADALVESTYQCMQEPAKLLYHQWAYASGISHECHIADNTTAVDVLLLEVLACTRLILVQAYIQILKITA